MIHPLLEDTIAAIATPNGVGAVLIIRISGNKAITATDAVFEGKTRISEARSHTVHYGKIVDSSNTIIDDVLLTNFKAPNSYTGEDVVEISCHGNPLIGQKILEILLEHDVRIAEPGEFTKRAFLNNRIDLAQAEAVMDVVTSRSGASLRGARNQLDGLLSANVSNLRNPLLEILSFIELELDFAEEQLEFVKRHELVQKINMIIYKIDFLLQTYTFGRIIRDGVNVAIVGKPNVGKSSLLNYLLKESRAIVSDVPGTTRDILREEISIDGILFKLFDTAGIREAENLLELEGIRRSNEAIKNADLVLFLNDVEQGFSEDLFDELKSLTDQERIIPVMNKSDLNVSNKKLEGINISALTGSGIPKLLEELKIHALGSANYSEKSAIVSNMRHCRCLSLTKASLSNTIQSIEQKFSSEFIAVDLRNSVDLLGEIIGEVTSDDVLNNIFSKFCIGK
jgi:tRNA modification GTPase